MLESPPMAHKRTPNELSEIIKRQTFASDLLNKWSSVKWPPWEWSTTFFRAVISSAKACSPLSHQNHEPWPNTHQVNSQYDLQHFHWAFYVPSSFDMHEINHNVEYFIQTLIQIKYTNQNNVAIIIASATICVADSITFKLYGLFQENDGTQICVVLRRILKSTPPAGFRRGEYP